jgi:hypothetical protein
VADAVAHAGNGEPGVYALQVGHVADQPTVPLDVGGFVDQAYLEGC